MKYFFVSIILIGLNLNLLAQFSRMEATEIVATEVVGLELLDNDHLYSKVEKIYFNDTLWLEYYDYLICPMQEAWVFFIDDMPIAHWAHPCRYIWFDCSNGDYQILEHWWPPEYFFENYNLFQVLWDRVYSINDVYTRQEAIEVIVTEVVGINSLESNYLFSKYEIMEYGDTLWLQDFYLGYYLMPYSSQYVFFVDDNPIVFWAHPCRIIFFDPFFGAYEVFDDEWPPHPYLSNYPEFIENWEWILETGDNTNQDMNEIVHYSINPNPFQNQIEINIQAEIRSQIHIKIYDLQGHLIRSETKGNQLNENTVKLNLWDLKRGVYYLVVSNKNGIIIKEKIIKTD